MLDIKRIIHNCYTRAIKYAPDYINSHIFLQILRVVIALPTLSYLFFTILRTAQIEGITNSTLLAIFHHPFSLLLLALLLVFSVFFIYYEIGYYLLLAYKQKQKQSYTLRSIISQLNQKAKYFLSLHTLLFIGYFLLLLPIVASGFLPLLIQDLKIPDFIIDELLLSTSGKILYGVIISVATYIALRMVYSIFFFITDPQASIWTSIQKSWSFSKGRTLQNIILFFLAVSIFGVFSIVIAFIVTIPLFLTETFIPFLAPIIAGITLTTLQILLFIFSGFLQPILANVLVETVITKMDKTPTEERSIFSFKKWIRSHRWLSRLAVIFLSGLVIINIWSTYTVIYQPTTKIIAHRGFLDGGVENSLGSLRAAAKVNADYVEMDIQETKDQQFVVMHDVNLNRLAKLNQYVYDMTLAELEEITIYQNSFTDKIPSLADYIDEAKRLKIKLLIEIKPHGFESEVMSQNLARLLAEKSVIDSFLVQSLDLAALDALKSINPAIKTGYVVPLNIGNLPKTQHDFLVLEEFSITNALLQEAKNQEIPLFLWTINKDELLKKYLRQNVDAIITNHPDRAFKIRENSDETKTFINRVRYLLAI